MHGHMNVTMHGHTDVKNSRSKLKGVSVESASTEKKVEVVRLHVTKTYRALNVQVRSFVTSALDWMGGQCYTLAALTPGIKTMVPVVQEAGWTLEPVWTFFQMDCQFIALNHHRTFHKNRSNYRDEQN
jgi:hypothetical protein